MSKPKRLTYGVQKMKYMLSYKEYLEGKKA